jgi:hypothetical protein
VQLVLGRGGGKPDILRVDAAIGTSIVLLAHVTSARRVVANQNCGQAWSNPERLESSHTAADFIQDEFCDGFTFK